ncbi:MAG: cytochrome c biogenesis protein CcdA [Herminiimonas sp.]|nr:cytochrome c biogenesis protein CcdA [Herminiimonas sp.]
MDLGAGSYAFGFAAGVLSTLSPCVLPIVPILLGSAANAHPRAPLALAAGLALSYAVVGSTLAWAGSNLGLDPTVFKMVGAAILGALGLVLMSASLQRRFASATAGIGDAGNQALSRMRLDGIGGQFAIGLALGVVWSPCVGPTLGAAVVLASQGANLPQVASLMGVFGIGAALPILALAYASRSAMAKMRGSMMRAGQAGKMALGAALVAVAAVILLGLDKPVEAWLVERSPAWLTELTTRF